jgi:hypothetical protein
VSAVRSIDEWIPIVLIVIVGGGRRPDAAAMAVIFLWLLGFTLAMIGFFQSHRLCRRSKGALALHVFLPIAVLVLWFFGWMRP